MTPDPACCTLDTSVDEIAKLMVQNNCGEIPIVNAADHVVGVVTDRDIVCRVVSEGCEPATTMVSEVMTKDNLCTCRDDQTIEEAARLMEERQIRRIPVLDRYDRLIGLITMGKIAKVEDEERSGEVLKEVVQPKK